MCLIIHLLCRIRLQFEAWFLIGTGLRGIVNLFMNSLMSSMQSRDRTAVKLLLKENISYSMHSLTE
jgi:Tfp pilus assembly protein PilV